MRYPILSFAALSLAAACSVGDAGDTTTWVREKSASEVVIGIHISLLNHPEDTHALGYQNMQSLADTSCSEFGKSNARYTGKQEQKTRGTAYGTWIERTYRCA